MKRAIITGATGAIGTALVNELISNGVEVLVFCHKGSPRNKQIPENNLVTLRYCSLNELSKEENDTGKQYDLFYHLAWQGTTGVARDDMYLQNENVKYSLDAVSCAKRFGCNTFIGIGSQAEYGRTDEVLRPNTPAFPENGYGMAKLCAGQMTRNYANKLGMRHIWVRVLSVYGPNDGSQSLVMSTIRKLKNGEIPEFTKGEQMWDYLYSADAASCLRLLGEKGVKGKTYVLGSGESRPLREYIEKIRDAVSPLSNLKFGVIPYADKQVMSLRADISALKNDTGWMPKNSFLDGVNNILKFNRDL